MTLGLYLVHMATEECYWNIECLYSFFSVGCYWGVGSLRECGGADGFMRTRFLGGRDISFAAFAGGDNTIREWRVPLKTKDYSYNYVPFCSTSR